MRCIRSGADRCSFDIACVKAKHNKLMRNHRESHLPCCDVVYVDICKACHSDLPGHVINRIKGLCKIAPPDKVPKIRIGANCRAILNTCINCPAYKPCEKDHYDILFYIAHLKGWLECLNDMGRENIKKLQEKFRSLSEKELVKRLCKLAIELF